MKSRPPLPKGPYLIVGLERSGVAAALALERTGERVVGVDSGLPKRASELADSTVEVHLEDDGMAHLEGVRTVVKSPGVPGNSAVLEQAHARGLTVTGELELGWRMLPNEFIAVTGTNGKTTTVELIGHIHRRAKVPVAVAGNVGTALSTLAGSIDPQATIVCEASSFQLEDTLCFAPEAALLLNIAADHLDRHGTIDAYRAAKLRLFSFQDAEDLAVLPAEGEVGEIATAARRVHYEGPGAVMAQREGALWWRSQRLIGLEDISLRGAHNLKNAMAAAAVCLERGITVDGVAEALASFPGVAHRLEEIARRGGVIYVNDSKATNIASTLVALASFPDNPVRLILGGQGKDQDFAELRPAVQEHCPAVYLIGEDAPLIAAALAGTPIEVHHSGELEDALLDASRDAHSGEVVLLSPACASFDQFTDFQERGERFRELVVSR